MNTHVYSCKFYLKLTHMSKRNQNELTLPMKQQKGTVTSKQVAMKSVHAPLLSMT